MLKRLFEVLVASLGLILLSPVVWLVAFLIKTDSPGPVFFRQVRVGKRGKRFLIFKFRTMIQEATLRGAPITFGADPRITKVGRLLRRTKIDELPQLINVLKGEMSLVGPRPEVPLYVKLFETDYEEILQVNPGITDLASLKYQDEASILGESANPEEEYIQRILPDKIKLAKEYLTRSSFFFDLTLVVRSVFRLFGYRNPHFLTRSTNKNAG